MKTESRRDQKGLRVLSGLQTKAARRSVLGGRKVTEIVAAAEHLSSGCILYRLSASR